MEAEMGKAGYAKAVGNGADNGVGDGKIRDQWLRLLAQMAQGRRIEPGGGRHRLGERLVGPDEIRALASRDLIGRCGDGAFVINDRGRALLTRIRAERRRRAAARAGDAEALAVHDPFRDQHLDIKRCPPGPRDPGGDQGKGHKQEGRGRWLNASESPLGWLHRRRDKQGRPLVSALQVEAGDRLRTDFELAGMSPRVTASWDGVPANLRNSAGHRDLDPSEVQVAAHRRFARAMDALGPGLSEAAIHTCCLLEGLEDCERRMGWPPRSGKVVLGLALDRLTEHYGLKKRTKMAKRP